MDPINSEQLINDFNRISQQLDTHQHLKINLRGDLSGSNFLTEIEKPKGFKWILVKIFRYKHYSERHETIAMRINVYIFKVQKELFKNRDDINKELDLLDAFEKLQAARMHFLSRKLGYSSPSFGFFRTIFQNSQNKLRNETVALNKDQERVHEAIDSHNKRIDLYNANIEILNKEKESLRELTFDYRKQKSALEIDQKDLANNIEALERGFRKLNTGERDLEKEKKQLASSQAEVKEKLEAIQHNNDYLNEVERDLHRHINRFNETTVILQRERNQPVALAEREALNTAKDNLAIEASRIEREAAQVERAKSNLLSYEQDLKIEQVRLRDHETRFAKEKEAAAKILAQRDFILHQHPLTVQREKAVRERECFLESLSITVRTLTIEASVKSALIGDSVHFKSQVNPPLAWILALREAAEKGDNTDCLILCSQEESEKKRSAEDKPRITSLEEDGSLSPSLHAHSHILTSYTYFKTLFRFNQHPSKITEGDLKKSTESDLKKPPKKIHFSEYPKKVVSATLDWLYLKQFRTTPSPIDLIKIIELADVIQESELTKDALIQIKKLVRTDFKLLLQTICIYLFAPQRAETIELFLLEELHIWFESIKDAKLNKTKFIKDFIEYQEELESIFNSRKHYAYQITLSMYRSFLLNVEAESKEMALSEEIIEEGCKENWSPALHLRTLNLVKDGQRANIIMTNSMTAANAGYLPALHLQATLFCDQYEDLNLSRRQGFQKALKNFLTCAENEYLPSMNVLGYLILTKDGDLQNGVKWLELAVARGCGRSAWLLFQYYNHHSMNEAIQATHWLQQSAALEYGKALEEVADRAQMREVN